MTENIQDEINRARIDCRDVDLQHASSLGFDLVQPKYDGWWVLVSFSYKEATVYSTSGRILKIIPMKNGHFNGVKLIGEFMYGTNWAQRHFTGTIFIHDCLVEMNSQDCSELTYDERDRKAARILDFLQLDRFIMAPTFSITGAKLLWDAFVDNDGFEGLVYKNSNSRLDPRSVWFGRTKKDFTMDYIVMGFIKGQGKHTGSLGSLEAGLIIDGKLQKVTAIGGGYSDNQRAVIWNNRELYLGRVFEAKGKQVFPSGALRHGNFIRFRDDKTPERCTWPKDGK